MYSPAAAWQMSAECHALMMQAFNIAKENVDEMVAAAKAGEDGFAMTDAHLITSDNKLNGSNKQPLRDIAASAAPGPLASAPANPRRTPLPSALTSTLSPCLWVMT